MKTKKRRTRYRCQYKNLTLFHLELIIEKLVKQKILIITQIMNQVERRFSMRMMNFSIVTRTAMKKLSSLMMKSWFLKIINKFCMTPRLEEHFWRIYYSRFPMCLYWCFKVKILFLKFSFSTEYWKEYRMIRLPVRCDMWLLYIISNNSRVEKKLTFFGSRRDMRKYRMNLLNKIISTFK